MAKFLQDTLDEMAVQTKERADSETAKEFAEFFEKVRSTGEQASNEDIIKFSKLFEDEITLDSLSRPQLIALCQLVELQPLGTNNFLRFQLRMKLRNLKADDQMIKNEGVDSLTVLELQAACRARGMRSLGITEERLRSQLVQWLELSLNECVPPSLLLLSRALYLPENLPASDQLKVTLSSLPDTAATEAKYRLGEIEGKVDNKTKIELIKKEEGEIKKEAEELLKEELKMGVASHGISPDPESLHDFPKGKILETVEMKSSKEELSKEDIHNLEDALETVADSKVKLLIEKEEIEDLKEEVAEYKHGIEELEATVLKSGYDKIHESKAALRLSKKVDKMISNMEKLLSENTTEEQGPQKKFDIKITEGADSLKKHDDVININELLLAIRLLAIQEVPDNTRLQRISEVLEKMDVDHDGSVEVDHVLKVIELIGKDNIKVTGKQVDEIIALLVKEYALEIKEKKQKQNDT